MREVYVNWIKGHVVLKRPYALSDSGDVYRDGKLVKMIATRHCHY